MESLLDYLSSAVNKTLPGQEAQAIMMPTMPDHSRFSMAMRKEARPGGVMILLFKKNGDWYFPLIQRPDYDGVHAKQMSFPGGKKDEGDENLVMTALRETEEEIGVEKDKINVIGSLTEMYIIASNFNVFPTIGYLNEEPIFKADAYEVDEIISVKLEELMDDMLQKEKTMTILQGITINAPYFELSGKVVWGATAMILSEFKFILQPFFKRKGLV